MAHFNPSEDTETSVSIDREESHSRLLITERWEDGSFDSAASVYLNDNDIKTLIGMLQRQLKPPGASHA